jgi:hypothetical protein
MFNSRKGVSTILLAMLDIALVPILAVAALPMRLARRVGTGRLPLARSTLQASGVLPLIDHYYEPMFKTAGLKSLREPRSLPGIDLRVAEQKALLAQFTDIAPLLIMPRDRVDDINYFIDNQSFISGDAEIWFHMVRHFRPRRIIEIGSGHSTRLARMAITLTKQTTPDYACEHICIEPYEAPWLEQSGATIVRQRVEDVDLTLFDTLGENDILFIDSSHIIRPQGDVLVEYLEIIPRLKSGVIVHVHDIFSPRDYLDSWVHEDLLLWNEQYLLEAYLSENESVEVLLGVNMMMHEAPDLMRAACPHVTDDREPGSFYFRKIAPPARG